MDLKNIVNLSKKNDQVDFQKRVDEADLLIAPILKKYKIEQVAQLSVSPNAIEPVLAYRDLTKKDEQDNEQTKEGNKQQSE